MFIGKDQKTYTVCGIIAEFNPFHKGHEYLIREARSITGCDYVIIIMSGNFVQDGSPAIIDKYTRTHQALLGGADLILELPVYYATASAEAFAFGAVATLQSIGIVDYLVFGSETANIQVCQKTAELLLDEPASVSYQIQEGMKAGESYPLARAKAMKEYFFSINTDRSDEIFNLLQNPNDILGIEYCKALLALHSPIKPLAIQRKNVAHGRNAACVKQFTSATNIRSMIYASSQLKTEESACPDYNWKEFLPDNASSLLENYLKEIQPVHPDALLPFLQYAQIQARYHADETEIVNDYMDWNKDLFHTFANLSEIYSSYEELVLTLKSKNITQTRIQRALLHLLLKIPPMERFQKPSYLRLLGFTSDCQALRKAIKELTDAAGLPLITKVADYKERLSGKKEELNSQISNQVKTNKYSSFKQNEISCLQQFELQLQADEFYSILQCPKQPIYKELKKGPVII